MIKICIVHFNTQRLTECLLLSIQKYTPNSHIYLFDNSNKSPFENRLGFDNITYYDNTKGQIINFDKWLQKYPDRFKSGGKTNTFGSAKHCYSVEKCIELINDNFILLDSDVLLKKDISELYDDKYFYVGETRTQPKSTIKRVLPFICFINVKKCNENGLHYFYEDKMHGLRFTNIGDMYDTGAGFYYHVNRCPHKHIKCDDYIEHFKGGSWGGTEFDKINRGGINEDKWLDILKPLWMPTKNRKVIYTCITGGYDTLIEPSVVTEGFDYICFTDCTNIESKTWEIRQLPEEIKNLNTTDVKRQRAIKILPHRYLSEYDISIWVDGNVLIRDDLNTFINKECNTENNIFIPQHPIRQCIYDEAKECIRLKKDTKENIEHQVKRYKLEGLPLKEGMVQSNIIVRRHNSENCIRLMEQWWNELYNGSHRDQLSFNYVLWKNPDIKITLLTKSICNSEFFFWGMHKANKEFNRNNTPIIIKEDDKLLSETKTNITEDLIKKSNVEHNVSLKQYMSVGQSKHTIIIRKNCKIRKVNLKRCAMTNGNFTPPHKIKKNEYTTKKFIYC